MMRAGTGWRGGASATRRLRAPDPARSPASPCGRASRWSWRTSAPRPGSSPRTCCSNTASSAALSVIIPGREPAVRHARGVHRRSRGSSRGTTSISSRPSPTSWPRRSSAGATRMSWPQVRDELAIQLADMTRLHALSERLSNSLELPAVLRGGPLGRDRAPGDRPGRPDALRPRAGRDGDGGQRGLRPRAARGRRAGDPRQCSSAAR